MEAINFVKENHKPFIGDIDINVKDEDGLTYCDNWLKYCCGNHCDWICDNCFNGVSHYKKYFIKDEEGVNEKCPICNKEDILTNFYQDKIINIYSSTNAIELINNIIKAINLWFATTAHITLQDIISVVNDKPKEKEELIKLLKNLENIDVININDKYRWAIHYVLGIMNDCDIMSLIDYEIKSKRNIELTSNNIDLEVVKNGELKTLKNNIMKQFKKYPDFVLNVMNVFDEPKDIIDFIMSKFEKDIRIYYIQHLVNYNEELLKNYIKQMNNADVKTIASIFYKQCDKTTNKTSNRRC